MLKAFLKDESAAVAIEYALIASLISVAMITSLRFLGFAVNNTFTQVSSAMNSGSSR